jgi:polysaccharide pyruvyl transferase WcaK-like protein
MSLFVEAKEVKKVRHELEKSVILFGYYGAGNFGDEIMLRNLVKYLTPRARITVVAYDIAHLGIEQEGDGDINIIKYSKKRSLSQRFKAVLRILYEFTQSDFVAWGGGTLLFDNVEKSYWNLRGILRIMCLSYLFRKKFLLIGIGIGEINTKMGRRISSLILKAAFFSTFRDDKSLEEAKKLAGTKAGVMLRGADLALLDGGLINASSRKEMCPRPLTIAVCGMEFDYRTAVGSSEEQLSKELAGAFDYIAEKYNVNVCFVPMQTGAMRDDNKFHRKIRDRMRYASCTRTVDGGGENFFVTLRELREADLVVGMRLHSLIVAVSAAIPVFALVLSEKVRRFMHECDLENFMLEVSAADCGKMIPFALEATIIEVKKGTYPSLTTYVTQQRAIAEKSIAALVETMKPSEKLRVH